MKCAGIVGHSVRPSALACIRRICEFLHAREVEVRAGHELARAVGEPAFSGGVDEEALAACDLLIAVGGDGTLLAAARLAAPNGVPVLGVHAGGPASFGFLTETTPDAVPETLSAVLAGDYRLETRLVIAAEIERDGTPINPVFALNDLVIRAQSRLVRLGVEVAGTHIATYAGDGVILSTPTGSTAYNLAAGGPLVYPGLDVILITPICSHTLNVRTIVVHPEHGVVTHLLSGERDETWLTVDGQLNVPLQQGDAIRFRKADHSASFISLDGSNFYRKVQRRFRLGERFE